MLAGGISPPATYQQNKFLKRKGEKDYEQDSRSNQGRQQSNNRGII